MNKIKIHLMLQLSFLKGLKKMIKKYRKINKINEVLPALRYIVIKYKIKKI